MPSRAKEAAAKEPAGPPPMTSTLQLCGTSMLSTIIDNLQCRIKNYCKANFFSQYCNTAWQYKLLELSHLGTTSKYDQYLSTSHSRSLWSIQYPTDPAVRARV